jgi:hypothetical protein
MKKWHLVLAAAVGGVMCLLFDMAAKAHASSVLAIANGLRGLSVPSPHIVAVALLIALAMALCFVFDPDSKKKSFYLGASILAIGFTLVPYAEPPRLRAEPNSTEIAVELVNPDGAFIDRVTVTVWDGRKSKVLGRSVYNEAKFRFYLEPGEYVVSVEVTEYKLVDRSLDLRGDPPTVSLRIELERSPWPMFLQRAFR